MVKTSLLWKGAWRAVCEIARRRINLVLKKVEHKREVDRKGSIQRFTKLDEALQAKKLAPKYSTYLFTNIIIDR